MKCTSLTQTHFLCHDQQRGQWQFILLLCFSISAILGLLLSLTLWFFVMTQTGSQTLWRIATYVSPYVFKGKFSGKWVGGRWFDGIQINNIHIQYQTNHRPITINADTLETKWQWNRSSRHWHIHHLTLHQLDIHLPPSSPLASKLPEHLIFPMAITLDKLQINTLRLHHPSSKNNSPKTFIYHDLTARLSSDKMYHTLMINTLTTPIGNVTAKIDLHGQAPFSLTGNGTLQLGKDKKTADFLTSTWGGNLSDFQVTFTSDPSLKTPYSLPHRDNKKKDRKKMEGKYDATFTLKGQANITAFAAMPLKQLILHASHFDPRLFYPNAPMAKLQIDIQLESIDHQLAVHGPIHIRNTTPGSLAQGKLPITHLDANLQWASQLATLTHLDIALLGDGRLTLATNSYDIPMPPRFENTTQDRQFTLTATHLNLHHLHSTLQNTRLSGLIALRLKPDDQKITLDLSHQPANKKTHGKKISHNLHANITAQLTRNKINVTQASFTHGSRSRLEMMGALSLDETRSFSLTGHLHHFDPAVWIKTNPHKKSVHGDIQMTFNATGQLSPYREIRLTFELPNNKKSLYHNLPMTGKGLLHLRDQRLLPSDVSLSIAGNQVHFFGSFGAPESTVTFHVNTPKLHHIGFGLSGKLRANGKLSGDMTYPKIHAKALAENLIFGEHTFEDLALNINMPGTQTDHFEIKVVGHGYESSKNHVHLTDFQGWIKGTPHQHHLETHLQGKIGQHPLALMMAGEGKLQSKQLSSTGTHWGWKGTIKALRHTQFPLMTLVHPISVSIEGEENRDQNHHTTRHLQQVRLGPTQLAIDTTHLTLDSLSYTFANPANHWRPQWHSKGQLNGLHVNHFLVFLPKILHTFQSDLVLDTKWHITRDDKKTKGFFQASRQEGDILVKTRHQSIELGLKTFNFQANWQTNSIQCKTLIHTNQIGIIDSQVHLGPFLQKQSWLNTPLLGTLNVTFPDLSAPFFGPNLKLKGLAKAALTLSGTLTSPLLSGKITGDQLGITLFKHDLRLRDGIARLELNNNDLNIKELAFSGNKGEVQAQGQLQFDNDHPNTHVTIVAKRLQLFTSPDKQLIVSGKANVQYQQKYPHITGNFMINEAFFNFPKQSAPVLGKDVVILKKEVHPEPQLPNTATSNFYPTFNINVDFGKNFHFKSHGADLRLKGILNLYQEPNLPLGGIGTLETNQSTYEIFGKKLDIERGIINFSGPINNPDVFFLVMRHHQAMKAGAEVTGPISSTRITLVSEPDVPDEDKLSWLLFGHTTENNIDSQEKTTAQALALLGNIGGKKIAQGIGLDGFSIGASESGLNGGERVVNLSKALTDTINIGYEQSLSSAANVFRLIWQITKRWQLIMRGGTINGLEISYNHRSDQSLFNNNAVKNKKPRE